MIYIILNRVYPLWVQLKVAYELYNQCLGLTNSFAKPPKPNVIPSYFWRFTYDISRIPRTIGCTFTETGDSCTLRYTSETIRNLKNYHE